MSWRRPCATSGSPRWTRPVPTWYTRAMLTTWSRHPEHTPTPGLLPRADDRVLSFRCTPAMHCMSRTRKELCDRFSQSGTMYQCTYLDLLYSVVYHNGIKWEPMIEIKSSYRSISEPWPSPFLYIFSGRIELYLRIVLGVLHNREKEFHLDAPGIPAKRDCDTCPAWPLQVYTPGCNGQGDLIYSGINAE